MKSIITLLTIALVFISIASIAQQQQAQLSQKEINKWVNKKDWAKGLTLNLHPTVNKDSFYVAYHRNAKLWDAAFAFLRDKGLDTLSPGKYPIVGTEVFASVTVAPSNIKDSVKWESHHNYVDLQYIIKGKELIGIADTSQATINKPYTVDAINYTAEGKYYVASQGEFFLFFPNNAHRPTIKVDGYDIVKKIVIKIQTATAE